MVETMSTQTYEPSREWDNYCEQEERYLANRHICSRCKEPIAEDFCYDIEGGYVCKECLDRIYKVQTPVDED